MRVHTYSLTYDQSILCFYMMGHGTSFTMREVASSDNSYPNCHYDIYQDTKNQNKKLRKTLAQILAQIL